MVVAVHGDGLALAGLEIRLASPFPTLELSSAADWSQLRGRSAAEG